MRTLIVSLLAIASVSACKRSPPKATPSPAAPLAAPTPAPAPAPAAEAAKRADTQRQSGLRMLHEHFKTQTVRPRAPLADPPPEPPAEAGLARVKYRAPLGEQWAYVSPDPGDGKRHPAVVWAAGGFDFSIGDSFFEAGPPENDQSAAGLRKHGIIVMYPSYRGTHDNPGVFEALYGEVDDYLAAAEHLRALPYVDPGHVYLAGHSTGGTLVLLAAAMSEHHRAAFALGPVDQTERYGNDVASFDPKGSNVNAEWHVRAPISFVSDMRRPTILIDGSESPNSRVFPMFDAEAKKTKAPLVTVTVPGKNHFSVIAPELEVIAEKILADHEGAEFRW